MSEFSLDDILDKYAHKDGEPEPGGDADDILNAILGDETSPRERRRSTQADEKRQRDDRRRQELEEKKQQAEKRRADFEKARQDAEDKKRAELAEKQRIAEQKKLEEEERRKNAEAERKRIEDERKAEEEKKKKAEKERRRQERENEIRLVIEEKERREQTKKKKQAEEEARKQAAAEEERKKAEEAKRQRHEEIDELQRQAELAEQERQKADDEKERLLATKSILLQDVPIEMPSAADTAEVREEAHAEPTTAELQLEKTLRQQKIEIDAQKLLIKETELEDPDDFLNAMNPYEFGRRTGYTDQIETISAQQLSGDTRKVDAQELKELSASAPEEDTLDIDKIVDGSTRIMPEISPPAAGSAIDPDSIFEPGDDIKEFVPKTHDTKEVRRHSEEEERLLSSINKTIEQERLEEMRRKDPTADINNTGPFKAVVMPTKQMKIDTEGGKVLRTGEIPMSDPTVAEQKLKELAAKRKRRLSNFVLEDITDEDIDFDDDSDEMPAEDDYAGIWTDLVETQKSLRIRFVLLFIVTIGLIAIDMMQRIFIVQKVGFFGNELGLLSNDGIVYANLICGVIGMALCSSVMMSGIGKLFRARADCDSVCAVSCVVSLLAGVLQLVDTNDMQQGRAFIYVPAALLGLLFNSFGKLIMIKRAKKNYRFITSDSIRYYAEVIDGQSEASAFTKGTMSELPYLVTLRKTELFTDFLKKSYCEDLADRLSKKLVPISLLAGLVLGVLVYFLPNSAQVNGVNVFEKNIYWSVSVFVAVLSVMSPFSMMFMVNNPLRRATKAMTPCGTALMGYTSAEEFGEANSVLIDASTLFPKSAVECTNIKPCKLQNSLNNVLLDQAIILAASLAVKTGSVLSGLFFDMIGGNKEMLADIDGCIYEDNMGVMGWYGNKRVIMGSREHMKQHGIKIPELSAIAKFMRNGSDSVYMSVGGELAVIFFIRLTATPAVRSNIKELMSRGVSISLKTTDSLITVGKITDLFDIDPEKVKIIGASLHELYNECTAYTPSGCGALACSGSFVSLAKGINSSKKLLKDVSMSRGVLLAGVVIGVLLLGFSALTANTFALSPILIIGWNILWLLIMLLLQCFRRY
ncbi:MAG: hypothetical protein IJT87_00895 [Ruminiclostridium sp.]|nr:hypothetical protein [Ruminiclostridium sp.]